MHSPRENPLSQPGQVPAIGKPRPNNSAVYPSPPTFQPDVDNTLAQAPNYVKKQICLR